MRIVLICAVLLCSTPCFAETWPSYSVKPEWVAHLDEILDHPLYGSFHDTSYKYYLRPHLPFGDYLNYSKTISFRDDGEIVMANGLPRVHYAGEIYDNPVTLAQHALSLYGRFIEGKTSARAEFLAAIDKLISLQSHDGSFRYPITFDHKGTMIEPGWVSAMAQGQALSAFARALQVDNSQRLRTAGELTLSFLQKPIEQGGLRATMADLDPSLAGYLFFPEYATTPLDYTLNGYIFTLLGLYDWSHVAGQAAAKVAFTDGVKTLERILPYYDIGGYSAYDLGHVVSGLKPFVPDSYLTRHVYLLHAIQSIAPSAVIAAHEKRWTEKLEHLNTPLRFDFIIPGQIPAQTLGSSVTLKVQAGGGDASSPDLFEFAVKYGKDWTIEQPYSTANTFTFKPFAPGQYYVQVFTKDQNSTRPFDNVRTLPFVVTGEPTWADHATLWRRRVSVFVQKVRRRLFD